MLSFILTSLAIEVTQDYMNTVRILVVVIIIVGGWFFFSQKNTPMESSHEQSEKMMADENTSMMSHGSYEIYSPEKLARAETGTVVLFFKANWCPSCRSVDTDIKAHLGDIPEDLSILEVDYDNSVPLKQKYAVTYQHTFVQVSSDGTLIKKWSASPTLAAIVTALK
jgi:thioredoxin 1